MSRQEITATVFVECCDTCQHWLDPEYAGNMKYGQCHGHTVVDEAGQEVQGVWVRTLDSDYCSLHPKHVE